MTERKILKGSGRIILLVTVILMILIVGVLPLLLHVEISTKGWVAFAMWLALSGIFVREGVPVEEGSRGLQYANVLLDSLSFNYIFSAAVLLGVHDASAVILAHVLIVQSGLLFGASAFVRIKRFIP